MLYFDAQMEGHGTSSLSAQTRGSQMQGGIVATDIYLLGEIFKGEVFTVSDLEGSATPNTDQVVNNRAWLHKSEPQRKVIQARNSKAVKQ